LDIWTERLERAHLPAVSRWLGRRDGALTDNDLPADGDELAGWYARCEAEPGRLDCLALAYETPVGLAGLRPGGEGNGATLWLLLGELGYNPLRTATYITLRMLDRAFLERGLARVCVRVRPGCGWYREVLEKMGFSRTGEGEELPALQVEKQVYLGRKYLF